MANQMLQVPVLLSVARLNEGAYGMAITEDIQQHYKRTVNKASVYVALQRMEADKLIKSKLGEESVGRGGRKRIFMLVKAGRDYLRDYYLSNQKVWQDLEHYLSEHRFI